MPYGPKAKYIHHRQIRPGKFVKNSFRIVPLSHTKYKGKKFKGEGVKAIVGILKKTKASEIQSILVPK